MTTKERYLELCEEIWRHNRLYYAEHTPEISDEAYDKLFRELEHLEREHPDWISASSPTQHVNEKLTEGFKTIRHKVPMLSLANTYSKEEIEAFIARIEKLTGKKETAFSVELKMDGIAISAFYEKGKFVRGATRGDGKKGDDITANMRGIGNLPSEIKGEVIPSHLDLRGEVYMPRAVFEELNAEKEEAGEALWANPRNAAAGSLKLLDAAMSAKRGLAVVFYAIAEEEPRVLLSQSEVFPHLRALGLPVLEYTARCTSIDEIWAFAEKVRAIREKLPYQIDGIVIKVDDLSSEKHLGSTGKNPRWAIAYKFAAERASTVVLGITTQVGRSGQLTPVAELQPVFLAGSEIARATLHNQEEVHRKDIRIGDTVIIEKGGDVIPKVVEVDLTKRLPTSKPWAMPSCCPSCGTAVVKLEGEVAVRCPNEKGCPAQISRRLIFFCSKGAMDIDHMGEKVVQQLIEKGMVRHPSDIFTLTEEQLSQLKGYKEKSIGNLLSSIEKSKKVTLAKFIMALGIKHVGAGTAELLSAKYGAIHALMRAGLNDLESIEGVGSVVAESIIRYFSVPQHCLEVERLLSLGVTPEAEKKREAIDHPFADKTFVLTGTLSGYTRDEAAALIKERGGRVTESVSKKTNYILVGQEPGSKFDKGKKLGVPILTEAEFTKLL